jgi:hypothetical protein
LTKTPAVIELLRNGTDANNTDPYRQGNVIVLPNNGSVIICGDLHGHVRNFERIRNYADLGNNPTRHLVLQEIIHGGREDEQGGCMSYELLFEAARLKTEYPHHVHLLMGNHDTAYISDSEVMKGGKEMNASMRGAMKRQFETDFGVVDMAVKQFLFSQPLAVRCANRLWISHSLPGNREAGSFDEQVLHRPLQVADLVRPNSVYNLTWGRRHSEITLMKMAELFDVDAFILGHQAQADGCSLEGCNLIILASDHNHGCMLPVDLARTYSVDELFTSIVPIASVE